MIFTIYRFILEMMQDRAIVTDYLASGSGYGGRVDSLICCLREKKNYIVVQ